MPRMEKLNLQSPIFKVVNIPNILFAAILYMISLPPLVKTKPPAMLIIVICLIELYFIIGYLVQHKRSCHDISCILFFCHLGVLVKNRQGALAADAAHGKRAVCTVFPSG